MYTIYYQYALIPGIIHEAYAITKEEAEKRIADLKKTGYGAWLREDYSA